MTFEIEILAEAAVSEAEACTLQRVALLFRELEPTFPPVDGTVCVHLTSDSTIAMLHDQFFGDPSPTDVITFPGGDDWQNSAHLGDIAISIETAAQNASDAGHSTQREVAFLLLHGLLHLSGWGDSTPEDRAAMLDRQEALLCEIEFRLNVRL